ncbi:TPA: hypothetical protein ACF1UP_002728, partial [Enterococcus hirae]
NQKITTQVYSRELYKRTNISLSFFFDYNSRHKRKGRNLMPRENIYTEDPTIKKKNAQSKQGVPA